MTTNLPPLARAIVLALLISGSPAYALNPDGLSREGAIRIVQGGSAEGVASQYEWLRTHYPGWRRTKQALLRHEGRVYDRLTIESPSGETRRIYFDITAVFGKT